MSSPALARGRAGIALLLAYSGEEEAASAWLECAIDEVANSVLDTSLHAGFTGIAWAVEHLRSPGTEDSNEAIDEALLEALSQPWRGDYDLVGGLVGIGVYALERPRGLTLLERVVAQLSALAQHEPAGVSWYTAPPSKPFNLGVPHGIPGVIALLGVAGGRGMRQASQLVERAVEWLFAHDDKDGFPVFAEPERKHPPARLSWCYGDAGIAAALLASGQAPDHATALALRAARRSPEATGVVDAGLCHGAAGLGHLFNRMYQTTGEALLGDAARLWFTRALAMERPGQGLAGYQSWLPSDTGGMAWAEDPSFLTGVAGIGLALLAATSERAPAWDRVLLASVSPR